MPDSQASELQRRHDESDDRRGRTQRDRDRVLYSSAFARLSGVTQVAPADEGAPYHTRMTHSLKVAQISRRIAEYLQEDYPSEASTANVDPDSCEAAALAHDLGHPPFGHAAEHRLDKLMRRAFEDGKSSEEDGFEGNAQSFRIVVRLAQRREGQEGLNLTQRTLDAILKYPWLRRAPATTGRFHKFGAYLADRDAFEWTRSSYPVDDIRRSPNADIMDWADDVAYAVHDVEDFYRAGLIPFDRLVLSAEERRRVVEWMARRGDEGDTRPQEEQHFSWVGDQAAAVRAARRLFEEFPLNRLTEPYEGSKSQRAALRQATALLIRRFLMDVRLDQAEGSVRFKGSNNDDVRSEIDFLKGLVWYYVIERPALRSRQQGQLRVIDDLFETYLSAANDNQFLLPESMREAVDSGIPHARATVDLIASLTERQAVMLWGKISGVEQRPLRDFPLL